MPRFTNGVIGIYTTVESVRNLCKLINVEVVPGTEVEECIRKAQNRIDNVLRRRYQVPLVEPVPQIVNSVAADMAAAFLLDKHYSDRSPDRTHLADIYTKRAETDLERIVNEGTIDDLIGVVENEPPVPISRLVIATTTPEKSPIKEIKW